MRQALALAVSLASLLLPAPVRISAQDASAKSPKVWVGHYQEYEDFLKAEPVVRMEDVPIGVTKPRRGYFKPGGLAGSALMKALRPSRESGFFESYESEIAAYEMDKILGLDFVPPTVERRVEGQKGSAQLWVDNVVQLTSLAGQQSGDIDGWNIQIRRWRVFHNLVANLDPNQGNNLVLRSGPIWHLILVDHSRAFTPTTKMVFEMARIDKPFFEKLKALDKATLDMKVGKLVIAGSNSILKRRDIIVKHFEKLAKDKGEAEVFTP